MPSSSSISRAAISFLVGESIFNVVVAKVELYLWQGLPLSKVGPIALMRSISFPSLKVPSEVMNDKRDWKEEVLRCSDILSLFFY